MSTSFESLVLLPGDLHARPAGQFCQAAAKFHSTVVLGLRGKEIDARSVLQVMALGAGQGAEMTVRAIGDDAELAVATLSAMLASLTPIR
jgi:phosphotransferase system HPr (HPr) family protein